MNILDTRQVINAFKGLPVYNKTSELLASLIKPEFPPLIYGWHVDPSISDPSNAITYIGDAMGKRSAGMTNIQQTVKGYRDLDYIQSSKTQAIITDYIPKNSDKTIVTLKLSNKTNTNSNHYLFGCAISNTERYCAVKEYSNNTTAGFYAGYDWSSGSNYNLTNVTLDTKQVYTLSETYIALDSTSRVPSVSNPYRDPTLKFGIFGFVNPNGIQINDGEDITFYNMKSYNSSNELIHEFIPVERISDGELGIIDTITETFYSNVGTGTFIKGSYITTSYWFDYGDWNDPFFIPKPCMLKSDGTVDYYLDENDYSKKAGSQEETYSWEQGNYGELVNSQLIKMPSTDGYYNKSIRTPYILTIPAGQEWIISSKLGWSSTVRIANSSGIIISIVSSNSTDNNPLIITASSSERKLGIHTVRVVNGSVVNSVPSDYGEDLSIIIRENSDISNSSYDGNAMMEWPLIYYKFESLEDRGYQLLESITSNGDNDYIITDIVGLNAATDSMEFDMSFGNLNQINDGALVLGCATINENNGSPYWQCFGIAEDGYDTNSTTRNNRFFFYHNSSTGGGGTIKRMVIRMNNNYNSRSTFKFKTPTDSIYNISSGTTYSPTIINPSIDVTTITGVDYEQKGRFTLFAAEYYEEGEDPIYYCCNRSATFYSGKIYRNNKVIHNFLPVKRLSDNKIGIYDTINNKFYGSVKDTLVAGNTTIDGNGWFYCSNKRVDNTYHCWCNYDSQNNIIDHFYTAIYNGTIINNKMRSLSGLELGSNGGTNQTGEDERTAALANNINSGTNVYPEWYMSVWSDYTLISGLIILLGKSLDVQHIFGLGITKNDVSGNGSDTYVTGTANTGGLFTGSITDSTIPVKIFGIENWWGCNWHRTIGLGTSNIYAYKLTYGTIDGTSMDGYAPNSGGNLGGYIPILSNGNTISANTASGYIKTMFFGKHGFIPIDYSGTKDTYWSCYGAVANNATAVVGSDNNPSLNNNAGLCIATNNVFGAHYTHIGTSLSCKPLKTT